MSQLLPFHNLDSTSFAQLCSDLLVGEGALNVRGLGSGPDQGSDLLVDIPISSPLHTETVPFIVQCKCYDHGRVVGEKEIGDVIGYLSLHGARGLLFVTSSRFSGTAITKANAIHRDHGYSRQIVLWDAAELTRRLRSYPELIAKYWHGDQGMSGNNNVGYFPRFSPGAIIARYAPPPRYKNLTIDGFPRVPSNHHIVDSLSEFAKQFSDKPPIVTIVQGGVGTGKTGFAYALLNARREAGSTIAGLNDRDVDEVLNAYEFSGDDRLPALIGALFQVDFLLLDDFGFQVSSHSNSAEQVAFLVEVVRGRIARGLPTILTCYPVSQDKEIDSFLETLRADYTVIDCGTGFELRQLEKSQWFEELATETQSRPNFPAKETPAESKPFIFLTSGWIAEKLGKVEVDIEDCIHTVEMSEREFLYSRSARFGQNRDQIAAQKLRSTFLMLRKYREHIDSFAINQVRK